MANFLSSSFSTPFLHPMHLQECPQYPWFWKHSQYNFRHLEFLQLQDLTFFFLFKLPVNLISVFCLLILCFLSELTVDSDILSDLKFCANTLIFLRVNVLLLLLSIKFSGISSERCICSVWPLFTCKGLKKTLLPE